MRRGQIETHRKSLNMKITGLRLLGIWSLNPPASSLAIFIYYLYGKFIYGIILIFIGTLGADLILNYNDLLILTDDGCYFAGISVIVVKLFLYQTQHQRIFNLVEDIHKSVNILCRSSDPEVQSIVKKCMYYENLTGKSFLILGSSLAVILVFLVPKQGGGLPIRAVFPFDVTSLIMFRIAFGIQMISVFYGLLTIVLMDELMTSDLLVSGKNHLNVEGDRITFRSFIPFLQEEIEEFNDSFAWRFKTCAKNHQRFIDVVDELNSIFGMSMLAQLFASFSMICLTAFQAVLGGGGAQDLLKFIVYLGAACSQLVNWCWFGNELLYQSGSLVTSQWLCGWEKESLPNVRAFMITSLLRTRHPLQLRAGKYYNMSMQTFIAVLRNSYSFFALLTHVTTNV